MTEIFSFECDELLSPHTWNETSKDLQIFEPPILVRAIDDNNQIKDKRILSNLQSIEFHYLPHVSDFLNTFQSSITSQMRKIVADWLLEIVHDQNCHLEVFCLALNIMDRFLCQYQVEPHQMQLLGSVCLFLSSKFKASCHITSKSLIYYADYSITEENIKVFDL